MDSIAWSTNSTILAIALHGKSGGEVNWRLAPVHHLRGFGLVCANMRRCFFCWGDIHHSMLVNFGDLERLKI